MRQPWRVVLVAAVVGGALILWRTGAPAQSRSNAVCHPWMRMRDALAMLGQKGVAPANPQPVARRMNDRVRSTPMRSILTPVLA
jgi:hypothetical protein